MSERGDDENRTRVIGLEDRGSTIKLHPRDRRPRGRQCCAILLHRRGPDDHHSPLLRVARYNSARLVEAIFLRRRQRHPLSWSDSLQHDKYKTAAMRKRDVAQLGRVLGLGPRCRRFDSCHPDETCDHPDRAAPGREMHRMAACGPLVAPSAHSHTLTPALSGTLGRCSAGHAGWTRLNRLLGLGQILSPRHNPHNATTTISPRTTGDTAT